MASPWPCGSDSAGVPELQRRHQMSPPRKPWSTAALYEIRPENTPADFRFSGNDTVRKQHGTGLT
jgi:hypothetical protein